jgi:hypothetical protein
LLSRREPRSAARSASAAVRFSPQKPFEVERWREVIYNAAMNIGPKVPADTIHDGTLIDWFLSLEPIERLAELESRLAFFNAVRRDGDTKLPPNPGTA